jgi:uncharacterized protein YeaO (DUF488 family)
MALIQVKRIYEPPARGDGLRILVDRIWPRGISKEKAALDFWAKDVAPSTELRKWFHHDPGRWIEFRAHYLVELKACSAELDELRAKIAGHRTTLLFAAANITQNHAHILKGVLER